MLKVKSNEGEGIRKRGYFNALLDNRKKKMQACTHTLINIPLEVKNVYEALELYCITFHCKKETDILKQRTAIEIGCVYQFNNIFLLAYSPLLVFCLIINRFLLLSPGRNRYEEEEVVMNYAERLFFFKK